MTASAIRQFKKNVNKVNASERFPYQINVCIGMSESTPQRTLDPYDAVKEASQRMRKSKRDRRRSRLARQKEEASRKKGES